MADKYAANEKVFAKLKGFPPWPAKIMERAGGTGKDEKYRIIFYGTHDEATVKIDQLFLYNAETKKKHGKPSRKSHFNEAMAEIEAEVAEEETGNAVELVDVKENQGDTTKGDSEGELMIDEGPSSLPPVLKREIEKPDEAKRPRTLSKRDSLPASPVIPPPTLSTPVTPSTPDGQPGTEIVSRSGRKIKPKRFADDEISTGPDRPSRKSEPADGQPASKRPKRGSTSVKLATPLKADTEDVSSPSLQSEDLEPPAKTKTTPAKGKATAARLSPDIAAPDIKGPPTLKVVPKRTAATVNKQIPALEPTVSKTPTAPVRKSERQTRSNSVEEKEEVPSEEAVPECSRASELDESEVDKENSNGEPAEETPAVNNNAIDDDAIFVKPRPKDPPAVPERKIRISTKNGLKIELSFEAKNPDGRNDEELNKSWQSIATQNVRKVLEDLKEGDVESQDIINSSAECIPSLTIVETKSREKLSSQLKLLRLEGEVIEIIGEIVGCLGVQSADCLRAIDLLDRLEEHKLNPLMLKKHPEVVHTVQKLRSYVGNVEAWDFTSMQKEEFAVYAEEIRRKSVAIFNHFQELFGMNSSESFVEVFQEEVKKFKDQVDQFPLKKMLGLTEENGELHELEIDLNGEAECDSDTLLSAI